MALGPPATEAVDAARAAVTTGADAIPGKAWTTRLERRRVDAAGRPDRRDASVARSRAAARAARQGA